MVRSDVAAAATKRSMVKAAAPPTQTENNLKLLGYGLFLLHIGLKPFETARQGGLDLSKRLAAPAPVIHRQGQHQSID
jgi:hypothetical protein